MKVKEIIRNLCIIGFFVIGQVVISGTSVVNANLEDQVEKDVSSQLGRPRKTKAPTATKMTVPTAASMPTSAPTNTLVPTAIPTKTQLPTTVSTAASMPTSVPTNTLVPTAIPTQTQLPTTVPTIAFTPTFVPTNTLAPTAMPTVTQTPTIAQTPTALPTGTLAPTPGPTNTFFASPNGTGNCTSASPCNLASGISNLNKYGGTLYLKSGTYYLTSRISFSRDGSKIMTAPGEPARAVLTGDNPGQGSLGVVDPGTIQWNPDLANYGFVVAGTGVDSPSRDSGAHIWTPLVLLYGNNITFENLEVSFSSGRGVQSDGSGNIIRNSYIHHTWNSAVYVDGVNNIVEGNEITRGGEQNYCGLAILRKCHGDWPGGLTWGDPHDPNPPGRAAGIIVRNNLVHHVSGEGIIGMHSDYALIENNVAYDNWALNIYIDNGSYNTIRNNFVYYTNDKLWWRYTDSPASNILISNEGIAPYPVGHDRIVVNNISVGGGSNFDFWNGWQAGSALINDLIANNTFVEAQGPYANGININAANGPGAHQNTIIANNIILQSTAKPIYLGSSGITFYNNLWSRTPTVSFTETNRVVGDPKLANPFLTRGAGQADANWYLLTANSLNAIDKGMNLSSAAFVNFYNIAYARTDYIGGLRGNPPDIGAHEYK